MSEPFDPARLLEDLAFAQRLARSLVGDASQAEDVVQESWRMILARPPRHSRNLRGYWSTILRRIARRRWQRERLRSEVSEDERATESAVDDVVARTEVHRVVVDEVLALKEPYRTTLLLHYLDELTLPEIAKRQGTALETVRTRLRRGLSMLRERMDARHPDAREEWLGALVLLAGGERAGEAAGVRPASAVGAPVLPVVAAVLGGLLLLIAAGFYLASSRDRSGRVSGGPAAGGAVARESASLPATARTPTVDELQGNAVLHDDGRGDVTGIVRDEDGNPVPGVAVSASISYWDFAEVLTRTETDAEGRFVLEGPLAAEQSPLQRQVASLILRFSREGFHPREVMNSWDLDGQAIETVLRRGRRAVGRILDVTGEPRHLLYAIASVRNPSGERRRAIGTSDENGVYFLALEEDEEIEELRCASRHHGSAHFVNPPVTHASPHASKVGVAELADLELPDLVLEPLGTLRGRALHPDGTPAANLRVEARLVGPTKGADGADVYTQAAARPAAPEADPGRASSWANTLDDGSFQIRGLQQGRYLVVPRLTFRSEPFGRDEPVPESMMFESGAEDVRVVCDQARLLLTVKDPEGRPLRSVGVKGVVVDEDGEAVRTLSASTGGSGPSVTLRMAKGARVVLLIAIDGTQPVREELVLSSEAYETRHTVVLQPVQDVGRLKLDVTTTKGAPVRGVSISLRSPRYAIALPSLSDLALNEDGLLAAIPPGEYRVFVHAPRSTGPADEERFCRDTLAPEAVKVRAGETTEARLVLEDGGRLSLQLADGALLAELAEASARPEDCPVALPAGQGVQLLLTPRFEATDTRPVRFRSLVPTPEGLVSVPVGLHPGKWSLKLGTTIHRTVQTEIELQPSQAFTLPLVLEPR